MRLANDVMAISCLHQAPSRSTACGSMPATAPPSKTSRSSRSWRSKIQRSSWSTRHRQIGCAPHKTIKEMIMSKVLVLYYSAYGHVEAMAHAVAEGARQTGAQVDVKRVPELVPDSIARKSH